MREHFRVARHPTAVLFVAIALFAVSTGVNVVSRISAQTKTVSTLSQTIDALERYCRADKALAVQYRTRGEDEVILTRSVRLTTTAFLAALHESGPKPGSTAKELQIRRVFLHRYRATLPRLRHILSTIHILPLIDCRRRADELREALPPGG